MAWLMAAHDIVHHKRANDLISFPLSLRQNALHLVYSTRGLQPLEVLATSFTRARSMTETGRGREGSIRADIVTGETAS